MAWQSNPFTVSAKSIASEMRDFAQEAGVMGLAFFKGSFRKQGFTDEAFQKWPNRKPLLIKTKGIYISKPNDPDRAILIKTGRLRRSLRKVVTGMNIRFSSDTPYSETHNEGATIKSRNGKTFFRIAKRQYMGESATLNRKLGERFQERMQQLTTKK